MKRAAVGLICSFSFLILVGPVGAQSFSIDAFGASVSTTVSTPDDIFVVSGLSAPVLSPPTPIILGDPAAPEVDALSYGRPLSDFGAAAPVHFSVDIAGTGAIGTAVAIEFGGAGSGSEAASDVFVSGLGGSNSLVYDGDGTSIAPNPAPVAALGTAEPSTYVHPGVGFPPAVAGIDDVDGFDLRSPSIGIAGSPTGVIYFSVDGFSLSTGIYGPGFSPADVFIGVGMAGYDSPGGGPGSGTPPTSPVGTQPYVTEAGLGFAGPHLGNDIDALVVYDDGDGIFMPGTDIVAFSLRPGSAYLALATDPITGTAISPGDVLVDGATAMSLLGSATPVPAILHTAESLGLLTIRSGSVSDTNLNALDMVVPEPSTLALTCLSGLAIMARRRGLALGELA